MPATSFGTWVKQRRKELDLTQYELALRVGCSLILIQKIEAGERRPSKQVADLLAQHLGVPVDERTAFIRFARERTVREDLPQQAPWRDLRARFTNLPVAPTPLFGQKAAVEAVRRMLLEGEVRLLTLVGPPGIGKTRLALEVGVRLENDYDDGVFLVPLASVTNPDLVVSSLARIFDLQERTDRSLFESLKAFLSAKRLLLILDNLEQVVAVAPLLAELLAACPWLQILTTSRVSLHVRAERQYRVAPLGFAPLNPLPDISELLCYPAVALFVDRAQAAQPDFRFTSTTARPVAEICARLDGLPLAIELVAAHARRLPLETLLTELRHPLQLLADGPRDLPLRHQALRAAIAWSYELLKPPEQRLFAQLSTFVGGCAVEAAQVVCPDTFSDQVPVLLHNLADQSLLVQSALPGAEPRFMMLETIREYAIECLENSGGVEGIRDRHTSYYLGLAERAAPHQKAWLDRLESEHDNLRAALGCVLSKQDAEKALRLTAALWPFWQRHGYLGEGLAWLDAALACGQKVNRTDLNVLKAKVHIGAGWLLRDLGSFINAKTRFEEGLSLYAGSEDQSDLAYARYSVGYANFLIGDVQQGIAGIQEALAQYRSIGDLNGIAMTLLMLGRISVGLGEYPAARSYLTECLEIQKQRETSFGFAQALGNLGEFCIYSGDYPAAAGYLEQSHSLLESLDDKQLFSWVLVKQAELSWYQGQLEQARVYLDESLKIARDYGYRWNEGYTLTYLGLVTLFEGQNGAAQILCEESLAIFEELESDGDIAQTKKDLARVWLGMGNVESAEKLYRECLTVFEKRGYRPDIAECLEGLATVRESRSDLAGTVHLLGSAQALRDHIGAPLPPVERLRLRRILSTCREQLGVVTFELHWNQDWDAWKQALTLISKNLQ